MLRPELLPVLLIMKKSMQYVFIGIDIGFNNVARFLKKTRHDSLPRNDRKTLEIPDLASSKDRMSRDSALHMLCVVAINLPVS